jgi:hypothetical protein
MWIRITGRAGQRCRIARKNAPGDQRARPVAPDQGVIGADLLHQMLHHRVHDGEERDARQPAANGSAIDEELAGAGIGGA